MNLFETIAVLLTLAALFSYLNHRFFGLPTTIGLMLFALMLSLAMLLLHHAGLHLEGWARALLDRVDFNQTLLHGMLSFLLFAGALHVNLNNLARQKWTVGVLATVGVVLSTILVGVLSWWVFGLLGLPIPLLYCLLFGALISPTDPIAVLAILKSANVSERLETSIAGESLFNDGVGVVVFSVLLGVATSGMTPSVAEAAHLFLHEAVGGALFGLALGGIGYAMLRSVDNYQVEVLITLAMVSGGYALADAWHMSGPLAIVVAGLLIGNQGRRFAMSDRTRENLDTFWELIDEVLNAVLFVLIGLEVLLLTFTWHDLWAGLLMIPVVLLARWVSVGLPIAVLKTRAPFLPHTVKILTWGGLRGGISVAMALSLPEGPERNLILAVTYSVVVFSILVQGLSMGRLISLTVPRT